MMTEVVVLVVTLATASAGGGIREIKYPFKSMAQCEEFKPQVVYFSTHLGRPVIDARCVLLEQGI